ncbi:MAG: GTP-binding protein [Candidatus Lokiarchaeota archaeon]|nr:GTP-binding protein [Candidatus Lokiarchaeota archaeon]
MASRKLLFKVVIVGDGGIGKSTMVQRLTTGKFIPQRITIGTDLAMINILVSDSVSANLQIWDFAGERRFRIFLPNYAQGATGCLLCYDITRRTSFESLEEWYGIVKNNAVNPVFILIGEKLDLADIRRSVEISHAEEFKEKHKIERFFETSSKSGENNKKIFETLTRLILKKQGIV